jgi:hypothetical protein
MDKDQELMIAIDEVVHYLWDPIGIAWLPEARDEYKGYIPKLLILVKPCSLLNQRKNQKSSPIWSG